MPAFPGSVAALSFGLAVLIDIGLGNHAEWGGEIIRRQLLGLLVFGLGVVTPTAVLAANFRSFWTIAAGLAFAVVLIVVFKLFDRGYRKRMSDLEFMDTCQEGAVWYPTPTTRHSDRYYR